MIDFINIKLLAKYLNQLEIDDSFKIYKQTINKKIFQDIDKNLRTDEHLKELLNNLNKFMNWNLNITKIIKEVWQAKWVWLNKNFEVLNFLPDIYWLNKFCLVDANKKTKLPLIKIQVQFKYFKNRVFYWHDGRKFWRSYRNDFKIEKTSLLVG